MDDHHNTWKQHGNDKYKQDDECRPPADFASGESSAGTMTAFLAKNKRQQLEAREDTVRKHEKKKKCITKEMETQVRQEAKEAILLWLKNDWKTKDDARILAGPQRESKDDYSTGSNPEPDFADVVGPPFNDSPIPLPPHYYAFIDKLPELSLPLQKRDGYPKCFCPFSPKLANWRNNNNLQTDPRYIPFCTNTKTLLDNSLSDHLSNHGLVDDCGINWHEIVLKYLYFLRRANTDHSLFIP